MNALSILQLITSLLPSDPKTKEAASATKAILNNVAKWDDNLINYLNERGYQMQQILDLLRPGTKSREYVDQNLPTSLVAKVEEVVNHLHRKQQTSSISRLTPMDNVTSHARGRYQILPIAA